MAMMQSIVHAYPASASTDPDAVLEHLNEQILCKGIDRTFVTALCMRYDPASRTVRLASAGHHPPRLKKPGAESLRFVAHDLHQPLPFASEFDLVVSGLVLEHLRELDPFFTEARRVLRPGGRAVVSAMHPAMFLRGSQARFTDPESGEIIQPGSVPHTIGAFVMAALGAGFRLDSITEHAPTSEFADSYPRAVKYIDWPMLVVMSLTA